MRIGHNAGFKVYEHTTHCEYCGREFNHDKPALRKTKEHVIPRHFVENGAAGTIIAACHSCNRKRSNLTPDELRARAMAHRNEADLLEAIGDRVDEIVEERGLHAPWLDKASTA